MNEEIIEKIFNSIGVTVFKNKPEIETVKPYIYITNNEFYDRVLSDYELGFGESYIYQMWHTNDLKGLFCLLLLNQEKLKKSLSFSLNEIFYVMSNKIFNFQKLKPFEVAHKHYDLGNDFYHSLLGESFAYSCAYWKEDTKDLYEAQINKFELLCQKADLKKGEKILDIGCGWGSFMAYAVEKYGVECVGLTVSVEQKKHIEEKYSHLPIKVELQDWRQHHHHYDKIISVGMFEHVGIKNYSLFFKRIHEMLKPNGISVIHTIGKNSHHGHDRFFDKYIFPNGELPDIGTLGNAFSNYFILEDLHNLGTNYEKTLDVWFENFKKHENDFHLNEKEKRIWYYYLRGASATFKVREHQLWQMVFTKINDAREQPKRIT